MDQEIRAKKNTPSIRKNTVLNLIKTVMSVIFPLITFPYVSRVLQPENIGKFNFGATYVGYFSLLASLGISTYAIRECSKVRNNRKELDKLSSQLFSINMVTTVIAYVALFVVLFSYPKLNAYIRIILIESVSIIFSTLGADWINSAMEDFKYITIRSIAFQVISLILMFIFVRKPEDYIKYAAITVFSSSGANAVNIFYRQKFCRIKLVRRMEWKRHIKPILLLFVMLVAQTIFSNSDITMLGLMRNDYEVGLYSTSSKIYNILNQLMASVLWVILPRLSNYYGQRDYSKINPLLRKSLQLMTVICFPCICGISVLSHEVLRVVGGASYVAAWPSLIILMASLFFSLIGGSFLGNMIMLPSGREIYFTQACIVAAVVNIVLNFFLIPVWGGPGAAFTTVLAHVVLFVMLLPRVEKEVNPGKLGTIFAAPAVGSIIIVVWCLIIKHFFSNLIVVLALCIIGGAALYFLALYLMKYELVMSMLPGLSRRLIRKNH